MRDLTTLERCWQCGGSLRQFGKPPIFDVVGDGLRVHKVCKEDALKVLTPNIPLAPIQGHTPAKPGQP